MTFLKIDLTPKTDAKPEVTKAEMVKDSVSRELFPPASVTPVREATGTTGALPEEKSQAANDQWIAENGAWTVIKQRGKGRTVDAVFRDMSVYRLGAQAASSLLESPTIHSLLTQPEASQPAHNEWVRVNLGDNDGRRRVLPLTGEGRTINAVGADIALAIAGAIRALTCNGVDQLPDEASQATNNAWVKANGAQGAIKLTGTGRTVAVVRAEMAVYKLGADAMGTLISGLLTQPEATQAAHNEWVKAFLPDTEERKRILALTGEGRTVEAVAKDIALAIAGASYAVGRAAAPDDDQVPHEADGR